MRIRADVTNQRFGRLVAIAPTHSHKNGKLIWLCLCDCGKEHSVRVDYLRNGHTRSCGCLVTERKHSIEESILLKRKVTKAWNRRHVGHVSQYRRNRTLSMHHITQERYDELLQVQGGVCAICKRPPQVFGVKNLDIDHDHKCCPGTYSCGKCVRGLICIACNRALGLFQDSLDVLNAAENYLKNSGTVGAVETERGIPDRGKLQSELHGDMQSAAEMTAPVTDIIQ